ncbi:MAG: type IVB secretion system protein IcmN/DotK [Legionella sp.]|nr:type IVB secretion system protein IcmN/DotK [Legionella sp.]
MSYIPSPDTNFKLPRKVANTSDSQVILMMKAFKRDGVVKVIAIGSDYLISIPSSALFPDQSPRLTWQSYRRLNQVVMFMKQFRKVAVNVTAYSSKYVSVRREQSLTLTRARAVSEYLWSHGIDSRFIFSEGAGSDKPITAMTQGGDNAPSSRIEITFRDAIV